MLYKIPVKFIHSVQLIMATNRIPREVALIIFVFWILAPTVDQCFDIALIAKLFIGPEADLQVSGGMVMLKQVWKLPIDI